MKIYIGRKSIFSLLAGLILLCMATEARCANATGLPHHDITVSLDPEKHFLRAVDTIRLPENFPRAFTFALHAGLNPVSADPSVKIRKTSSEQVGVPVELFEVSLPEGSDKFTLEYEGSINHPLTGSGSRARGIDQTPGSISGKGVYLTGSAAWYPLLETDFFTFSLNVELPAEWDAISQGGRTFHEKTETGTRVAWGSPEPQNEMYLVASRFSEYEKSRDMLSAQVYLRQPDAELAAKYLDATVRYIGMYNSLIAPYPYKKFALVENFWETGFGMPSFTLLGPTVIRLPFIINTSYPHEILHNWWGNSVYPDYEKGNWSEGLTAYLADHLLKEQQGAGMEYRLNTLQKYADYVRDARDFPLTRFTSRHSPSTEAVGYGKSLMFFHMLRRELGDGAFVAGMRHFYLNYKFRFATFSDIRKSLEASSGKNLEDEFEQWVTRTGAPEIRLRNVKTGPQGKRYRITAVIEQVQPGEPYGLHIPVAVTMEGQERAYQTVIDVSGRKQDISIAVPYRPLRVDVDPEFDVFRRLARGEMPPAITQALGANRMLVLLPSRAEEKMLEAYKTFAEALAQSGPDKTDVMLDRDIRALPKDRAVAVLGWENLFLKKALPALKGYGVTVSKNEIRIGQSAFTKKNAASVLAVRNPADRSMSMMIVAADSPEQLPGLARKLPHYHKYSYLVFEGDEPDNIARGRWHVHDSPLTVFLQDENGNASSVGMAKLRSRAALTNVPPGLSEDLSMAETK